MNMKEMDELERIQNWGFNWLNTVYDPIFNVLTKAWYTRPYQWKNPILRILWVLFLPIVAPLYYLVVGLSISLVFVLGCASMILMFFVNWGYCTMHGKPTQWM